MNEIQEITVGDIVAKDYRTAAIFSKHGIDFCCNGKKSIENACNEKGIDPQQLKADLDTITNSVPAGNAVTDYNSWPIDLLVDYIEKKHHRYVREQLPVLTGYLDKICKVHGGQHPELLQVQTLFALTADEFPQHMHKEEQMLFPYIRQLVNISEGKGEKTPPPFGAVQNPIHMMKQEHNAEGERFNAIRRLSNNYTVPADGCNTYRTTYALLDAFERDLHLHIHLENNILFPKAIKLEKNR